MFARDSAEKSSIRSAVFFEVIFPLLSSHPAPPAATFCEQLSLLSLIYSRTVVRVLTRFYQAAAAAGGRSELRILIFILFRGRGLRPFRPRPQKI